MATTQDWLEAAPSAWEAMYQAATELPSEGEVLALLDDGADLPLWLSARRDIGPPGSVPVGMEGYLEFIEKRVAETKRLPELVRTVRERVGDLRECEWDALREAVAAIEVSAPIIAPAVVSLARPDDTIIGALLCLRSLPEAAAHAISLTATLAVGEVEKLGNASLVPLLRALLRLAVEMAIEPRVLVDALVALAILETHQGRERANGDAIRLLDAARAIARDHCEPMVWANVIALWARQSALRALASSSEPDHSPDQLLDMLDAAQNATEDPIVQAKLRRARAAVVALPREPGARGDLTAAAALLEEALELAPEVDNWWLDTVRELAIYHLEEGRPVEAKRRLTQWLDEEGGRQTPADCAWVLTELARVHERLGDPAAAAQCATEVARLAGSATERVVFQVQRLVDLTRAGRFTDALSLARRLRPELEGLQEQEVCDHWQSVMVCEAEVGDPAAAREAYAKAREAAGPTVRRTLVELVWAERGATPEEAVATLLAYASGTTGHRDPTGDSIAMGLVDRYCGMLTAPQRAVVTKWAMALPSPGNAVSVLFALGESAAARATIVFALPTAWGKERLTLLCHRVGLDPDAPRDERRDWAKAALDTAAELDDLDFEGLHNLAQTCALVAGDDRSWWAKALEVWPRAWAKASDPMQQRQAAGRWLEHLYNWERRSRIGHQTALASWLDAFSPAEPSLSPQGVGNLRAVLAHALLHGALTHPKVLDAVEALGDHHPDALQDVLLRAHSIRQSHRTPNVGIPALDGLDGVPEIPQPVVDAALGHVVEAIPTKFLEDTSIWQIVCAVRPDLTDTTLAAGLRATRALSGSLQAAWMQFAHAMVQQGDWGGTVWRQLPPVVMSFPPETPGRSALLLTLQRAGADVQPGDLPIVDQDAAFEHAVAKMDRIRRNPQDPEAATLKAAAIAELEALVAARSGLEAVAVRISLANALRLPPEPDLDGAIEVYRSISQDELPDDQRGKLHKVWADALRHRAADGDLAEAWTHLDLALQLRKGRVLAETHLSAVWLALVDDSLPSEEQACRGGSHLVQCVELAPEMMRPFQQSVLAAVRRWARDAPKTLDKAAVRRTLVSAWPEAGASIDESLAGLSRSVTEAQMFPSPDHMEQLLGHPAMGAYQELTEGLAGVHDQQVQLAMANELAAMMGKAGPPQLNIWNDADAIRARLALVATGTPEERPGRAVAEVVLRARLVRLGEGRCDTLRPLTERARSAVEQEGLPPLVAASLLARLAEVWSPDNDRSDPVRDFALAVELNRAAIAFGPAEPDRDDLGRLARALRYSDVGDRRANWEEARQLLERVLAMDRAAGHAAFIANTLHLLSDLICQSDGGDLVARHREGAVLLREAVDLASTDEMKGRYLGNLAWDLSRIACHSLDEDEVLRCRDEAARCFDEALRLVADPALAANIRQNQTTFRSGMARRDGDLPQAIALERSRLQQQLSNGSPHSISTSRHNLGDVLGASPEPAHRTEAEALLRESLAHRRSVGEPRNLWETTVCLAELLLKRTPLDAPTRAEIHGLFTEAAAAARALGPGDELHRCARGLFNLALSTPTVFTDWAETAWTWLSETIPSLVLADDLARVDTDIATRSLMRTAHHALNHGPITRQRGIHIASAKASATTLTWWVRAESTWRRRSRARLESPPGVSQSTLMSWREAVAKGDAGCLPALLRDIHGTAPGWLTEAPTLDATRDWLRAHKAQALGAWPMEGGILLALVGQRPDQDRIAWLPDVGLADDEAALAASLRPRNERAAVLQRLQSWAGLRLAPALHALLGRAPDALLWVPHGALRYLPHASLFGSTPTWRSPTLALAPPVPHRTRGEGVAVVVAEPADQPIGDHALAQATLLAQDASVRLLMARGSRHGPQAAPRAEPLPVDAETVLHVCDHAGTVIVLAHGHAATADDAWLHLLRADGSEDRLDMARLSRDPRALAGLRIVLLSCEAGRTGDQPSAPGGIAGVLLAAGAAEVVAPLWPVDATAAITVGRALLDGQRAGKPWPKVLAALARTGPGPQSGRELGGRPSKGAREASKWDVPAFVSFVS